VSAGAGCTALREDYVTCGADGVTAISLDLGDGNDFFGPSTPPPVPTTISGGDGDDALTGTTIDGGPGNDQLRAVPAGSTINGGPGDDRLTGDDGPDTLDGGEGDDLIIAGRGADHLIGGPGLDRIDALGDKIGVIDTIDCQGRDDDILQASTQDKKIDCGPGPNVTISAPRRSVRAFLRAGIPLTVTCDRPCHFFWELRPTRKIAKLLHTTSGLLSRGFPGYDQEDFAINPSGPQTVTGRALGNATKKALGRLRSFSVLLHVDAFSREGVKTSVDKLVKIGR
jgi:Ca2+-binding RTX toxin-like protein